MPIDGSHSENPIDNGFNVLKEDSSSFELRMPTRHDLPEKATVFKGIALAAFMAGGAVLALYLTKDIQGLSDLARGTLIATGAMAGLSVGLGLGLGGRKVYSMVRSKEDEESFFTSEGEETPSEISAKGQVVRPANQTRYANGFSAGQKDLEQAVEAAFQKGKDSRNADVGNAYQNGARSRDQEVTVAKNAAKEKSHELTQTQENLQRTEKELSGAKENNAALRQQLKDTTARVQKVVRSEFQGQIESAEKKAKDAEDAQAKAEQDRNQVWVINKRRLATNAALTVGAVGILYYTGALSALKEGGERFVKEVIPPTLERLQAGERATYDGIHNQSLVIKEIGFGPWAKNGMNVAKEMGQNGFTTGTEMMRNGFTAGTEMMRNGASAALERMEDLGPVIANGASNVFDSTKEMVMAYGGRTIADNGGSALITAVQGSASVVTGNAFHALLEGIDGWSERLPLYIDAPSSI